MNIALLAIRNEERHLKYTLENLIDQGFIVYLIDNESDDASIKIAKEFLNKGVLKIDTIRFDGTYEWEKILKYKEELALDMNADWFMHCDADEIHYPCRPFKKISEALKKIENEGYNAINFDEFVFTPATEKESFEGKNFIKEMKYYYYFKPSERHRVKLWRKNNKRVDISSSGGHVVHFDGKQVYPRNFILRHYVLLSKQHALVKYGQRNYSKKEVEEKGWHRSRVGLTSDKVTFPDKSILEKVNEEDPTEMITSHPYDKHLFLK